jgi:hypothetical protein
VKTISKTVALISLTLIASPVIQAAPGNGINNGKAAFEKMDQSATFIEGDNLVPDVMPEGEVGPTSGVQSLKSKAAGLSAVMVTPNGEMFESKMDP